jgi:signal transduction histidine kinase
MNSVKGKYKQLQTVFLLLAALVAIQIILLYGLHLRNKSKLAAANDNVSAFLQIIKVENKIFETLVESIESSSTQNLTALNEEIMSVKKKLIAWGEKTVGEGLLTKSLTADEVRRMDSFQKVTQKIRMNELEEGAAILQIEKKVFFSRPLIVSSIIQAVIDENENVEFYIQSCFLLSLLLNIPVFSVLLISSRQLFKGVEDDIGSLVEAANSISKGDANLLEKQSCFLVESQVLYEAFGSMEIALKNRRMLSNDEVERAQNTTKEMEIEVKKSHQGIDQINEQLSRKNEELEQILYTASHDLRTPLIGVQGFSQELQYLTELLQEELQNSNLDIESNERLKDILKQDIPNSVDFILKGSNKMDTMIQGLLRISRMGLESFEFQRVDMDNLLKQIVDGLSFQAQSTNSMIVVDELDACDADAEKIEQVFTNLIANAIKYRRDDTPCEIKVSSKPDGNVIKYMVTDNGQGISEENLKNIHKTFFRVGAGEADGEGLGLTIANRIVERHRGSLEVTSTLGKGSCFTVILPVEQQQKTLGDTNE